MTTKPNSGTVSVSHVGSVGKYDEVLKPFMGMMEKELHANSGKGDRPGWLSMSADTCMLEIYYHLGKLQKAVRDANGDGICEFAADVANLSMMLTDICGALNLFAAAQPADQQGEPDFYEVSGNGVRPGLFYTYPDWAMEDPRYTVTPHWRSAAQPATAKVVLPERTTDTQSCSDVAKRIGLYGSVNVWQLGEIWNACLDEVAKLNGGQS